MLKGLEPGKKTYKRSDLGEDCNGRTNCPRCIANPNTRRGIAVSTHYPKDWSYALDDGEDGCDYRGGDDPDEDESEWNLLYESCWCIECSYTFYIVQEEYTGEVSKPNPKPLAEVLEKLKRSQKYIYF